MLIFVSTLFLVQLAIAQIYRVQHQAPTVVERNQPVQLSFEVPGINPGQVQDAFLFYKYDGEVSYQQVRAEFNQASFNVRFSIENENAGMLEYYFSVEMNDGQRITYPASAPESSPVQVDIVEREQQAVATSDETHGIEYTILSPEPGAGLPPSDVLVAITLFYEEGAVDTATSAFKLLLDGEDITSQAEASAYFFSYAPLEISPGEHRAALQLQTPGETIEIAGWGFTVVPPGQAVMAGSGFEDIAQANTLIPRGQVEFSAQNQEVGGLGNDLLRGNVRLSGNKGNIRYSAYGLLTSEETSRLQPQNRYGAELYIGNWFEFQGGHIYPNLSRLSISGRRVQGINTAFHLLNSGINLQFLYGKINRDVTNIYDAVSLNIIESNGAPIDTTYTLNFEQNGTGTFQRDVIGGRLGFGGGRNFQWGFNFLKVRDDTTSLATINNYDDLLGTQPVLDDNLSATDRSKLQSNPGLLSVNGNPRPKDNFIAGTDLMFSLFKNKIQFRTEGAISLLNEDISNGILSDDNGLGIDIDADITDQLDRLSWLIIINENMSTLPFRFNVQGEDTEVEPFFPTGVIASQSEFNFNLPKNNFRFQYRWIGPDYVSLANSTIRRDIAGYTATDRFQLFQNRLYVTLGYENLNDNVIGNKDATTNTNTVRSNLSWFPVGQFLPRVSLGVMLRNRDNGVSLFNPFASSQMSAAVRNFELAQGDTVLAPNARLTNTAQVTTSVSQQFKLLDITHDASLNVSFLNTKDDVFRYGDTKSSSFNFIIQSRLTSIPLNTRIGFNLNHTETLGGLSDFSIFGLNVGGSTFLMENKLNVSADMAFTKNTIESTPLVIDDNGTPDPGDDIFSPEQNSSGNRIVEETKNNLFIFRTGAQYNLNDNHAFLVNISFTNVSDQLDGVNLPNDHILQARYIYRF